MACYGVLTQSFTVSFHFKIFFTAHLFDADNALFKRFLTEHNNEGVKTKILFIVDEAVAENHPQLTDRIKIYFKNIPFVFLSDILIISGGEQAKNDEVCLQKVLTAINKFGIDRHSFVAAIGGGSLLDLVGYACAIAHRGIRHIRIPTTVLSQNDSGIGVKNSFILFGKKNSLEPLHRL